MGPKSIPRLLRCNILLLIGGVISGQTNPPAPVYCSDVQGPAPAKVFGPLTAVPQPYLYSNFPYRAIYRIVSYWNHDASTMGVCTATAIGEWDLVTAAHCVEPNIYGVLPDEIWAFPAQSDLVAPFVTDAGTKLPWQLPSNYAQPTSYQNPDLQFGVAKVANPQTDIFLYPQWHGVYGVDDDIAFLRMDRPLGRLTGHAGVDYSIPTNAVLWYSGYPGYNAGFQNAFLDFPTYMFQWCGGTSNYLFGGYQSPSFPQRLYFTSGLGGGLFGGMSGSALWYWGTDDFGNALAFVVAIYHGLPQQNNNPPWSAPYAEVARFIVADTISDYVQWSGHQSLAPLKADLTEYVCPVGYVCPPGPAPGYTPPSSLAPPSKAVIKSADPTLADTYPGSGIGFRYSAMNSGLTSTGKVDFDVYLSDDGNIDPGKSSGIFLLGTFTAVDNLDPGQSFIPVTSSNFPVPSTVKPGIYYLGWTMRAANPLYDDRPSQIWQNGHLPGTGERSSAGGGAGLKSVVITDNTVSVANFLVNAQMVTSSQSGATFSVNGRNFTQPAAFYVPPGQTITVSSPSVEDVNGSKWAYNSWSDNGGQTHSITATDQFQTITLTLFPRYLLTLNSNPAGAGTLAVANPTSDGYYDPSKPVQVLATASAGYKFTSFSGGFIGTSNPANVVVGSAKTVTGNFTAIGTPSVAIAGPPPSGLRQGHTGTFTLVVSNRAGSGGTTGTITVTENLPTGMTLVSMSGSGWTCAANQCTRSDALPSGSSYPAITVTVNVDVNAPPQLSNSATVSGGNASSANVTTQMAIGLAVATKCDLSNDGFVNSADVQQAVNGALGVAQLSDLNGDGGVTVADVQGTINAVLGLGCPF